MASRQEQPAEVDPDLDPALSEVTRPSDLGFKTGQPHREIEVEPISQPLLVPTDNDMNALVEIRMAETIEEFTYGNPHRFYKLEEGKRYRVPRYIAAYLWDLGKVLNTR